MKSIAIALLMVLKGLMTEDAAGQSREPILLQVIMDERLATNKQILIEVIGFEESLVRTNDLDLPKFDVAARRVGKPFSAAIAQSRSSPRQTSFPLWRRMMTHSR